MSHAERIARKRARPDRERDDEHERPPVPAGVLALQQAAGNRAVRSLVAASRPRALSRLQVRNIDYDPMANKFHHSNIDVPGMLNLLKDSNFAKALSANEKVRLQNVGTANLQADDIPHLAEAIVDHVVLPAAPGPQHAPRVLLLLNAHRPAVEGAIVRSAPKEVSAKEESVFKRILGAATAKSRDKGVPSQVPLLLLEAKMQAGVNGLIASLNSKHDDLALLATYTGDPGLDLWTRVTLPLLRDTPHQNRAGWLPALASTHPAPNLDALTATWVTGITQTPADPDHAAVTAAFPAPAAVAAADVQDKHDLDAAIKARWFTQVFNGAVPNRPARSRLAWKRWADAGFANCPYIEFAASDAGGISRIVWDFVNDTFYIGVHYNWVEGYSPFFRVLNTAATL